jgi:hypothetical protein
MHHVIIHKSDRGNHVHMQDNAAPRAAAACCCASSFRQAAVPTGAIPPVIKYRGGLSATFMLQDCGNRARGGEWVVGDLWSYLTTDASITAWTQFSQDVQLEIWQSCWQSGNLVEIAAAALVPTCIWARWTLAQAHTETNNRQKGPRAFLMSLVVARRGGSACMAREYPVSYVPSVASGPSNYFLTLLPN